MSDKPTIYLTANIEPDWVYDRNQEIRFAAHLAFDPSSEQSEASKQEIVDLLNKSSNWSYALYLVDEANRKVTKVSGIVLSSISETADSADLVKWLESRNSLKKSTINGVGGTEVEAQLTSVNARELLLGSIAWDAPIPHRAGLVRVVKVPKPDLEDKEYVILPSEADEYDVTFDNETIICEAFGDGRLITNKLDVNFEPPTNKGSPIDSQTGFLEACYFDDDYRFLRSFEANAASIYWSLPAFLELEKDITEYPIDPEDPKKIAYAWKIARLGCLMAVEPLLIALRPWKAGGTLAASFTEIDRFGELLLPLKDHSDVIDACIKEMGKLNADDLFPSDLPQNDKVETLLGDLISWTPLIEACKTANQTKVASDIESSRRIAFRCLRELMALLQAEQGVESLLTSLLSKKGIFEGHPTVKQAYSTLLAENFNGLNAVRSECGARYLEILLKDKRDGKSWVELAKNLIWGLQEFHSFTISDDSWQCVFSFDGGVDGKELVNKRIAGTIDGRFTTFNGSQSTARFVPDNVPQPVPIPISTLPNKSDIDWFTSNLNGVGVLLSTSGSDTTDWAHANLVDAFVSHGQSSASPSQAFKSILKPFLPVSVDGRREMFLPYRGFPLASPAYSEAPTQSTEEPYYKIEDASNNTVQRRPPKIAYGRTYKSAVFCVSKSGSLPELLQRTSGSPKPWELGDTDGPNTIDLSTLSDVLVSETKILRRTMIGSTAFGANRDRLGEEYADVFPLSRDYPRRILTCANSEADTVQILDLYRFAKGDGMLSLKAGEVIEVSLDQVRVDGNTNGQLELLLATEANADLDYKDNYKTISLGNLNNNSRIRIQIHCADSAPEETAEEDENVVTVDFTIDAEKSFWIRLRLSGTQASISFANEKVLKGSNPQLSSDDQVPVLLVGSGGRWQEKFNEGKSSCTLSRVTWMDWEQWVNNPSLPVHGRKRGGTNNDDWDRWAEFFLTVSLFRSEDPTGEVSALLDRLPDPAVSKFLVEVAYSDDLKSSEGFNGPYLQTVDVPMWWAIDIPRLTDNPELADVVKWFGKCKETLRKMDTLYRLNFTIQAGNTFVANKDAITIPEGFVAKLTVRPMVQMSHVAEAGPIDSRLKQFAIGCDKENFIFDGAKMLIESMYAEPCDQKSEKMEEKFDALMRESLCVVAHGSSRSYALKQPKVGAQDTKQVAAPNAGVKLFSSVDISTQRWRHTGRPIYHWIAPKDFASTQPEGPVIELKNESQVFKFEQGLFFEREDIDCDTLRCRLLGAGAELQVFSWDSPSATYFRHGVRFVSRYLGALVEKEVRVRGSWELKKAPWQFRCAILADSSRLEVTRPQVRCLIPMTQDVDPPGMKVISPEYPKLGDLAPTPAIAAILEEKPFSVGGLADRILAEIATGPGFGFETSNPTEATPSEDAADPMVQPLDFGKETSRDGRLDSRSWSFDRMVLAESSESSGVKRFLNSHQFVLDAEGPVGLHFDQPTAPSPSWSNCQYLLKPRSLNGSVLPEESFIGVRMRRVLDPAWVVSSTVDSGNSVEGMNGTIVLPILESYLIKPSLAGEHDFTMMLNMHGDDGNKVSVATLKKISQGESSLWIVEFNRQLLGRNYKPGAIVLASIPESKIGEIRFIHSSLGSGRFNLAVVVVHASSMFGDMMQKYSGIHNGANLIASTEWSMAEKSEGQSSSLRQFVLPKDTESFPLTSSSITFKEWTRTARNTKWFYRFQVKDNIVTPIETGKIRFSRTGDASRSVDDSNALMVVEQETVSSDLRTASEPSWIVPSTFRSRQPLYLQRHLVGVFSESSGGLGRQFDIYAGTQFLKGKNWKLVPELATRDHLSLEIFELEIPSKPLCSRGSVSIAPEFRRANFDLKTTGGLLNESKFRLFQLHLRLINAPAHSGSKWSIEVRVPGKLEPLMETPRSQVLCILEVTHNSPGKLLAIDIIFLAKEGAKIKSPVAHFHMSDGSIITNTKFDTPNDLPGGISEMSIVLDDSSEIWADVSLLHRLVPTDGFTPSLEAFDFDWLFSSTSNSDIPFSDRSNPEKLRDATEAQARFISSSRKQVVTTKNATS